MGCTVSVNYVEKEQVYLKPKEEESVESIFTEVHGEEENSAGESAGAPMLPPNEPARGGRGKKNKNNSGGKKYSRTDLQNQRSKTVVVKEVDNTNANKAVPKVTTKAVPTVATTSPLAKLIGIVAAMKTDADSRLAQRMNPSVNQLEAFVTDMANVLKKSATGAPVRIKGIIVMAFQSIQYDINKSCVTSRATTRNFNLRGLCKSLNTMLANLSNWAPPPVISIEESNDITLAACKLWTLDANRLEENSDFELDLQGEKNPNNHRDMATRALFAYVNPECFKKPTYHAFISLLDNYIADQGQSEDYTAEEIAETYNFLNLIMDTSVMQYCHQFLVANHKVPQGRDDFIELLKDVWFGLYRRKVRDDSSGFEHVFLGEREGDKVSGLHNWIQIYLEEKANRLDYKGKIKSRNKRARNAADCNRFISIQFEWMQQEKFISSSLIGTSPEFEFALLSMCYFMGKQETRCILGSHKVNIKSFTIKQKGTTFIGSAFPEEG